MGNLGASCFKSISAKTRDLSKEQWDQERFGQLCTKSDSFTNWKVAIEQLCADTRLCTYEEEQLIQNLGKRVEKFNAVIEDLSQ